MNTAMSSKQLFFAFIFFIISSFAQGQDYFAALRGKPGNAQYAAACNIYYTTISKLDSANACRALAGLLSFEEQTPELTVAYHVLMGDLYKELYLGKAALTHLQQALKLASASGFSQAQADAYGQLGWVYYNNFNNYLLAFECMLKANNIIQNEIGCSKYLYTNRFLYDLSFMYYDFGNVQRSRALLFESMKYPFTSDVYRIRIYNTLGLTYRNEKRYDSAAAWFEKAIAVARSVKHTAWTGITTGNLGAVYYWQNKHAQAIPMLRTDYELSLAQKQWVSAGNALWMWADVNIKQNNLEEAASQLKAARALHEIQPDLKLHRSCLATLASLYKKQHQYEQAVIYLDSARQLEELVSARNNSIVMSQAEQKVQLETHLADIKLLESESGKQLLLRNSLIVTVLLMLVIAIQFGVRMRLKHKKDQLVLSNARQQLSYYLATLREKNEMIGQFQEEIEHLNTLPEYILQKEKEDISDKLKKYTILTESHWNEFRHLFDKVHKGFFEKLKQKHPDLTPAETRLLSLLKLNLSKKEMAEMLGVSPETIKKTRQRIQHKVALPPDQHLEDLVAGI